MSSGSRSLHRKRRVLPRTYSLGCCRSLRMPLLPREQCQFHWETCCLGRDTDQTKIISCFSLPFESCFGQIS